MIACFLPLVAAAGLMTAEFHNGDQIHGHLDGIDETDIRWSADWLTEDTEFQLADLDEIRIPGAREPELPESDHTATATLSNGDELRGVLLGMDETAITLETRYAGVLEIRRDMVADLDVRDRATTIYRGPDSLDGWMIESPDGWAYSDGALVCMSSDFIRRDVGEHKRIHLSVDVYWSERSNLSILTHGSGEKGEELKSFYELSCQNRYLAFRKRTQRGNGRAEAAAIGSSGSVDGLTEEKVVRIEMFQDIEKGVFRLVIGGEWVTDWRDNDPMDTKMGPMLEFRSNKTSDTRISRVHVQSWDGVLEGGFRTRRNFMGEYAEEEETNELETGSILLRNGDIVSGEIGSIRDGKVDIRSELKEFALPVSRLRSFALRSTEDARDPEKFWKPIRRNGDIRAWFADGGAVTFRLERYSNGKLFGTSQTFGSAEFDFDAFSRIEFNLYRAPVSFTP